MLQKKCSIISHRKKSETGLYKIITGANYYCAHTCDIPLLRIIVFGPIVLNHITSHSQTLMTGLNRENFIIVCTPHCKNSH